jgi:hypothetical protein
MRINAYLCISVAPVETETRDLTRDRVHANELHIPKLTLVEVIRYIRIVIPQAVPNFIMKLLNYLFELCNFSRSMCKSIYMQ